MAALLDRFEPVAPTEAERQMAGEIGQRLTSYLSGGHTPPKLRLDDSEGPGELMILPASVVGLLTRILDEMAHGNAVTLVPSHAKLTTQEAADFLGISRPHLIKILESGAIPYAKVGSHRRIGFRDLVEYKKGIDAERHKVLDELAQEAQELGLGY